MYGTPTHLVIGFHACDTTVGETILAGKTQLNPSANAYDWLGSGRYFWEGNYDRAVEYAEWLAKRTKPPRIKRPFVIGAIIDLGHCLNFLETENLRLLQTGYKRLVKTCQNAGIKIPENKPLHGGKDLLLRHLDSAIIETIHEYRKEGQQPAYDSIRSVFWEEDEVYKNAGFRTQNHIQICVRNPNCIKGFFRPLKSSPKYPLPHNIT